MGHKVRIELRRSEHISENIHKHKSVQSIMTFYDIIGLLYLYNCCLCWIRWRNKNPPVKCIEYQDKILIGRILLKFEKLFIFTSP